MSCAFPGAIWRKWLVSLGALWLTAGTYSGIPFRKRSRVRWKRIIGNKICGQKGQWQQSKRIDFIINVLLPFMSVCS